MENTQNLIIKRKIARVCVALIICTAVFGTMLAYNSNRNFNTKNSFFSNSYSSENERPAGSLFTNSYKDK